MKTTHGNTRALVLTHTIVGSNSLINFDFDADKPYRACLICGAVFQSRLDRLDMPNNLEFALAAAQRQMWAQKHGKTHTTTQHKQLALSGRFCTPEAALVLVPLGLAPVSDMVLSDEHEHAARQAGRAPSNDVEGPTKGGSSAFLRSDL